MNGYLYKICLGCLCFCLKQIMPSLIKVKKCEQCAMNMKNWKCNKIPACDFPFTNQLALTPHLLLNKLFEVYYIFGTLSFSQFKDILYYFFQS